jgi:hypothetical protein
MDVIWVSSTCVKYLEKIVIQFQKMCFNGMFVFLFYLFLNFRLFQSIVWPAWYKTWYCLELALHGFYWGKVARNLACSVVFMALCFW